MEHVTVSGGCRRLGHGRGLGLGRGRLGLTRGGVGCLLLGLGLASSSSSLRLGAIRRSPEGKVITEELHDEGAVTVRFLGETIQLGNRIVEGLLGEMAGAIGRVEDLVVEYGEVEGEAETDRVGGGELGLRDIRGVLWRK